ncbi:MAG: sodium:calcium antiporter [Candidatus Hydrogenedentota bacterium]
MWLSLIWLVCSLAILTLGAEALVRGASGLASRMGVSSFFIGLTIVGFGTSTPELATGLTAALQGHTDVNLGNVVGSNIFNIALILGVTSLISPIPVNTAVVRNEVLIVIGASLIPFLTLATGGQIIRPFAALLVVGLVVYVSRGYRAGRQEPERLSAELTAEIAAEMKVPAPLSRASVPGQVVLILIGLGMLVYGSTLLVQSSVNIARSLGVSDLVIALTIVAAGTSAPELFTSLVAALRKQSDISIGNILGSNIFNVLGILGVTSLVSPQTVNRQVFVFDLPVMVAVSCACLPIMMSHRRISRSEGVFLLCVYAAYVTVLFVFAAGNEAPSP